jgi:DNA-directed RNA polymerase beta subunit/DNA-directed RNA polymerase beta' subunit
MAEFSPEKEFERLKTSVAKTVSDYFPVEGKKHSMKATKVWVEDNKHVDDIRSQKDAKIKGRSWQVPVRAQVELTDNKSGKTIDKQVLTVAQLPKVTRRHSMIVDGNEWQVNNQFRLKSGVYTRVKGNGELESQWNLAKGLGFNMEFNPDPKSRKMTLRHGTTNTPLYPVLKIMGMDDDAIERQWGKDILEANRKYGKDERSIRQLYKTIVGDTVPPDLAEVKTAIAGKFGETQLRSDSTKATLGKPFDTVNGAALLTGSKKILSVSRGDADPDDRDSLEFKDLYSIEDLLTERLAKDRKYKIGNRLKHKLDKATSVKAIVTPDTFGKHVKSFFTNSTLSERPDQLNPVGFIGGARKTTIGGEHGIKDSKQITLDAQSINPSHVGFVDPIQTPESERIGTILQMASAAKKDGKELKTRVYDTHKKKMVYINAATALKSNMAFPDQYTWKDGKPKPISNSEVKMTDSTGDFRTGSPEDVRYVLRSTKGMFDLATNMIPFLQSDQGNRTMVASRQLEQAVALRDRERPMVQTKSETAVTFEGIMGKFNSHSTPVGGTVEKVGKDGIIIKDGKGKKHEVQLYDNFPLNENKSFLHSDPRVKKGDTVKPGQVVADTNFTKDGDLAIGTNLRVSYMPFKGYNFEDGVVVSETAAKKMTSEHLQRTSIREEKNISLNKKKFLAESAGKVTNDQAAKLDDNGIIMKGQVVEPGDILIGALKKEEHTREKQQLALFSKGKIRPVSPKPVMWDKDYGGTVTQVVKHGKDTTVYVKTQAPATIGDKIVGRHGNKGIITKVVPDHEMPQDKSGRATEVILNPAGVPSRINLGQVLETAAGKIAEKTGKPYVVDNFDPMNKDYTRNLQAELKKHGLSDKEELFDPKTGKKMGDVLTGPQYMLKLHHTAEKKMAARFRGPYDLNRTPKSGGEKTGQTMDAFGLTALLAHGAKANIRESQTTKADMNDELWARVQAGEPIPTPQIPFAYKKLEGYLTAMGVDVEKNGNHIQLSPMTDEQTLALSNGELKQPQKMLRGKDAQPEAGGLFDPKVTGTAWPKGELGTKWSHITLSETMPNPVFEKPIQSLLGVTNKQLQAVIAGEAPLAGKTGPAAVVAALGKIDPKPELARLREAAKTLRGQRLNDANKKIRYLRVLAEKNLDPKAAYSVKHMPVMPPSMRPISFMDNGNLNEADVNGLYSNIGKVNHQLKTFDERLPPEEAAELQSSLYDGLKSLTLTGVTQSGRHRSGIMETLSGSKKGSPKHGYFQDKVIGRRQDLSARGVIIPEPSLGLDEAALPKKAATEIFKPFVVRRLVQQGLTPLTAQQEVKQNTVAAARALEFEMTQRPVMLKRDPVLHKYGVQAFTAKLTPGKAIKIHPLVTGGFNADFDGDTMAVFVPIGKEAVEETKKMMPSKNLFSPGTGGVMNVPGQEALLGLHQLSKMKRKTNKKYKSASDAAKAVKNGEIELTDVVSIERPLEPIAGVKLAATRATKTTVGRLLIHNALPEKVRSEAMLTDESLTVDKKVLRKVLSNVATKDPDAFARSADKLKDLGNSFSTGSSFSLDDLKSDHKDRDRLLKGMRPSERKILADTGLTRDKRDAKLIDLYTKTGDEIQRLTKARAEKSDNKMFEWTESGARGNWDQFRQMTVSPWLAVDSKGKTFPSVIEKSYSEGLDIGSYWASMYGARMGTIGRVQGTALPGAEAKQITQSTITQVISEDDCGTTRGHALNVDDRNATDRYTSKSIKLGSGGGKDKGSIPAGTLVTPEVLSRLKNNKIKDVPVRTPLKCDSTEGMCSKCFGLNESGNNHEPGVNIGILAAHSIGEPLTQLSMNAFHCNHADSLVFVCPPEQDALAITMEDLFNLADGFIIEDGEEEIKEVEEGWRIWDRKWVALTHVRRHAPDRPMVVVGDGGLITICQDNHPIAVWKNPVACIECGYHRLKAPSPASRSKKWTCPECKKSQPPQSSDLPVDPGFLPPVEIEKKKFYLHRDLTPVLSRSQSGNRHEVPGYIVGMFLAEGNVTFKRSHKKMKEKKPYAVYFSQKEGFVRDRLQQELSDWCGKAKASNKGLTINSLKLGRKFHSWFGRYSHSKALPPDFIHYEKDWIQECLGGLIDGDGTIERQSDGLVSVAVDTTSFALAQQMAVMAAMLGLHASVGPTTVRELTRHQGFKVRIRLDESTMSLYLKLDSEKLRRMEGGHLSSAKDVFVKGHRLVSLNREVLYTKEYVYDATTETGTLYVSGLRSHNTGGVAGSAGTQAVDKFDRMKQLVKFPKKLSGSATLSTQEGTVDKIEKDKATGGWNVHVGAESHYVPARRTLAIKKGDSIKKGDALSSGPKNPLEMLPLTGISSVQRYISDEMEKTLGGGSNIQRRNTEVFVRALTNLGQVQDTGGREDVLKGDLKPVSELRAMNKDLPKGGKHVQFTPILKGTNLLPTEMQTDWLARMQSGGIKDTLLSGAAEGWRSDIHGVHPIPGMAYGKSFGKPPGGEPWKY